MSTRGMYIVGGLVAVGVIAFLVYLATRPSGTDSMLGTGTTTGSAQGLVQGIGAGLTSIVGSIVGAAEQSDSGGGDA